MHELSVAYHLVQTASEAARRAGAARVTCLRVRIGVLSCVHPDALEFCYELAAKGTPVEGARLVIEEVPVEVYCPRCRRQLPLKTIQKFCCPQCGRPTADVRRGKELELASIEIPSSHQHEDAPAKDVQGPPLEPPQEQPSQADSFPLASDSQESV